MVVIPEDSEWFDAINDLELEFRTDEECWDSWFSKHKQARRRRKYTIGDLKVKKFFKVMEYTFPPKWCKTLTVKEDENLWWKIDINASVSAERFYLKEAKKARKTRNAPNYRKEPDWLSDKIRCTKRFINDGIEEILSELGINCDYKKNVGISSFLRE